MQANFEALLQSLLQRQNPDGGWGYHGGGSRTEATAYALLALAARSPGDPRPAQRALLWLRSAQRADGGWAPQPAVAQSTWVTALVLLAFNQWHRNQESRRAAEWLLGSSGRESSWVFRLRLWLLQQSTGAAGATTGWPWIPGSAGWVSPTALSILALQRAGREAPDNRAAARVGAGKEFLLARVCPDGGWNDGSAAAFGYTSDSYPETTGMALLALHGTPRERIARGIERAENWLQNCRSAEAAAWLRLALLAHGKPVPPAGPPPCRTVVEAALWILVESAAQGNNLFI
jgi:Prenyltransferase and squalene oxidase repeat